MGEFREIEVGSGATRVYSAGDAASAIAGVVVFHAWWGLNEDVTSYVDRLAQAGFAVAAPDLYDGAVVTTQDDAKRHARAADEEALNAIALGALDDLTAGLPAGAGVVAVGFSFGAHWTMWLPTQRDGVVGSVLYYGTTGGEVLTEARVPVLGHFAETDPFEDDAWLAEFEETLRSAGRDVVIERYPGTGHWFAEPSRDAYRPEAAALAFERTVEFVRRVAGQGVSPRQGRGSVRSSE